MDGWMAQCFLLLQQQRCEVDLLRGNQGNPQLLRNTLFVKEAEQLVGGPVAQLFSFVGIDVTHHQRHIILSKVVKACFLRKYTTDHFMGDLDTTFLIETLRVAVKHMGSAFPFGIELYGKRISEFAPSVGQNDRKQRCEHFMP